jgi:argininosuccinate lyase
LIGNGLRESIEKGHLDATTLMEALIVEGVPQRTAHETVGKLVRLALTKECSLAELSDDVCRAEYDGWNGLSTAGFGVPTGS